MRFTPAFLIFLFHELFLFIIRIVWWFRWLWLIRIRQTWVWIWVIWYVRYWIGCLIAWLSNSFRCHALLWWVVWWWQRVTCTPIQKIWWSGYHRIYLRCQYILYCTNISWIMDSADVFKIGWNGLNRVGVIRINVNQVGIFLIPI